MQRILISILLFLTSNMNTYANDSSNYSLEIFNSCDAKSYESCNTALNALILYYIYKDSLAIFKEECDKQYTAAKINELEEHASKIIVKLKKKIGVSANESLEKYVNSETYTKNLYAIYGNDTAEIHTTLENIGVSKDFSCGTILGFALSIMQRGNEFRIKLNRK